MYRKLRYIGDELGEIEVSGDNWTGWALTVRLGRDMRHEYGFSTRNEAENRGHFMLDGLDDLFNPALSAGV